MDRQCVEGDRRETGVEARTFEMVRDRGRATIRIGNDLTNDVEEFEGYVVQVIGDASVWAGQLARIRGHQTALSTIDISVQMERVAARCVQEQVCRNGRWQELSFRTREVGESEYFEKTTHREEVDLRTLRHILQTARNDAMRGGREELDRFCR